MTDRLGNVMRRVVVAGLAWAVAAAGPAGAADPAKFQEELSRQESIYQDRREQMREVYVIDRTLAAYSDALPAGFARALDALGPDDRWLDVGAGEGRAVLDYFTRTLDSVEDGWQKRRAQLASAVAMSIEDRRTPDWAATALRLAPGKLKYIFGRALRDYTNEELGRFHLVTDVIGGFSYTPDLQNYMEKTLAVLVTGGSLFTMLQDVQSETGENVPFYEGAPFLTRLATADGAELKVCTWLKSISCVQVTCELRPRWRPPVEIYQVRKTCDAVKVPSLLPEHYVAGTPPERRFRLKDLPAVPAPVQGGAAR